MKAHYRVVVIGGGVVGASVLYHLAKMGWSDVCLIERDILTAGSSWHAAGGFHTLNADPNMSKLQSYTIDLLKEIEKESGQDIGMHVVGGVHLAGTQERWDSIKHNYRRFQAIGIDDCELISVDEVKKRVPFINTDGIVGAMWTERDGHLDTTGTVHAYAIAAKKRGAEVIEHNRVLDLKQTKDGWEVITEKGNIFCEHVVNAAGLWAKQVGRMAGIELPVSPLAHHYLMTDTVPEIQAITDITLPHVVDLEGYTYSRRYQDGWLVGVYELNPMHWMMDGAPWNYGIELLQEDPDRIADELMHVFHRFPALENVGIKNWVHGAFTFSPDGNPLVGPVRGKRGYWCACAVMAGFLQGGGVGKSLAEWIIEGEPEMDIFGMDVARYGDYAQNKRYIKETTGQFYSRRFVLTYPNEQLPAGRPSKMAPAYADMSAAGARWGVSFGLETPLYFAPSEDFVENHTLRRSNAFDIVGEEHRAVREAVGLLDISAFSRYKITGRDAKKWLDQLLACKLPNVGRARLAPMLGDEGYLKGDLTVFNWDDDEWWLMGSYYLREWHMRWFEEKKAGDVSIEDISDNVVGFSLSGPNSLKVLEKLTDGPVGALGFMGCGKFDIGLTQAYVGRLSVAGELGFEINVPSAYHIGLRKALLEAGAQLGIREIGYQALGSLRVEKSFGIWSHEFTQVYTADATGMDRFVDWEKNFIGKEKAIALGKSKQAIVTLEIDAKDADASSYEPIWEGDKLLGYTTSGAYGSTVGKSLALGMVYREWTKIGTELTRHIVGEKCGARVIENSPHDPKGNGMRGRYD